MSLVPGLPGRPCLEREVQGRVGGNLCQRSLQFKPLGELHGQQGGWGQELKEDLEPFRNVNMSNKKPVSVISHFPLCCKFLSIFSLSGKGEGSRFNSHAISKLPSI